MSLVALEFGAGTLQVRLPTSPGFQGVITPAEPPALPDLGAAVRAAIAHPPHSQPLARLAAGRRDACVVVSDRTRAVPNPALLPPLLEVLLAAGIPRERTVILIATGLHEPSTPAQQVRLLGPEIAAAYPVYDHKAQDEAGLVQVGTLEGGIPLHIDARYARAELKLLTGLIEPHMWAGYSGGRKSIVPGISGLETVRWVHGPAMVDHPHTRPGRIEGNPFHRLALEGMALAGADFLVNVTVGRDLAPTGVFAGCPLRAHARGCAFLARHATRVLPEPLDFVLTTNGGAPLDCNLYQAAKGITGAADVVRPGGTILVAAACPDGPGSPAYRRVLAAVDEPRAFLARLHRGELFMPDQWCAQEAMRVALDRRVWIHSTGVGPDEVARLGLRWVGDIEAAVADLLEEYGLAARWAVVPDGPWVVLSLPAGSSLG
jgi:lactate racemase